MASRILGIDFGMKRIGLALSDETKILASPLPTFQVTGKLEDTVEQLVKQYKKQEIDLRYKLETIVVGFPLKMNGKMSFISDEVTLFAQLLEDATSLPVIKWDERLTSILAERALMEGSFSRKKRAKKIDQVSAVIILQNYLDSIDENMVNEI